MNFRQIMTILDKKLFYRIASCSVYTFCRVKVKTHSLNSRALALKGPEKIVWPRILHWGESEMTKFWAVRIMERPGRFTWVLL